MSSLTAQHVERATEISFEDATLEVKTLKHLERWESGGVEVYSGVHEVFGPVHIVIPGAGNACRLLPFAIRQF
jgi:hypothetical protein